MSELGNATKAPESDAQEPIIPGDTPAQSGPSTGEHCVTDRPTPVGVASTGEIIKLDDIDVYVSKPSDYPHAQARLLLLLTGGTGIHSVNNQIQADRFASEGYLVLMPDMFGGDPAPTTATMPSESPSLLEQFKLRAAETAKSFLIDMWLARMTEDKVMPVLHRVIQKARDDYADAVQHGDGIYAVGYCIGGKFVVQLAQEKEVKKDGDEESGLVREGPQIRAGAVAHAASVNPDDFRNLKAPLSLVCVEHDPLFTDETRTAAEDLMADANLEHEVKVYPGVPHGFAVVGDYEQQTIKDAQMHAYEQMLNWIKQH